MKFFSEDECTAALNKAVIEIKKRSRFTKTYKRGFNDCFALLAVYDEYLRGESRAFDKIYFEWETTKEFLQKLYLRGYTVESYLEYCGCHIIKNKRPMIGDVAFQRGAMINDGKYWITTDEKSGSVIKQQSFFLERKIPVIARPIRS